MGVRRRQHEDHVRWWFFQGLQESCLGGLRQHVDFVDDVDLPTTRSPRPGPRDDFANVVDRVIRGGVEFHHVERSASRNGQAARADVASVTRYRVFAVQRFGQNARRGGFTGTTRTGEEVGVNDAVFLHRTLKGPDHVLLAAHLHEASRTEAAIEGGDAVE